MFRIVQMDDPCLDDQTLFLARASAGTRATKPGGAESSSEHCGLPLFFMEREAMINWKRAVPYGTALFSPDCKLLR